MAVFRKNFIGWFVLLVVLLAAVGALWFVNRQASDLASAGMTQEAASYLDDALRRIESNAFYAERVDWKSVRMHAAVLAKNATAASDTHVAIRYALKQLEDRHSFLANPGLLKSFGETATSASSRIRSESRDSVGYISLPSMPGVGTDLEEAYADSVRDRLSTMDKSGVCGWIVDLRSNFGGNMGPMLTGLAPIMGEGAMLQWYHRPSWMTEYLGVSRIRTAWRPERSSGLSSANAPVALIIGKKTTSSGELVVVAFHGRKETKFFGEPTAGKPSGNEGYALRDGSMLLVTTALAVDRNGKIFSEAIQPDELIPLSYEESVDLRADTVVSAAKRWIHSASSCSPAQLIENTSK